MARNIFKLIATLTGEMNNLEARIQKDKDDGNVPFAGEQARLLELDELLADSEIMSVMNSVYPQGLQVLSLKEMLRVGHYVLQDSQSQRLYAEELIEESYTSEPREEYLKREKR